jgi:aminoglycoside 6'-N-acetyltransferase
MRPEDLELVEAWLSAPHVARWYLAGSSVEQELDHLRQAVTGEQPVHALVVEAGDEPIGWCQWYRCEIDPDWAADMGAGPGDIGVDYAIGEADRVGRGLGTELVRALVELVRAEDPAAVFSDPEERNAASRRVLEKNGFELMGVRVMASEPTDDPMAVYRLQAPCRADSE